MQEQLLQLGCSHTVSRSLLGERFQGQNQLQACLIPTCIFNLFSKLRQVFSGHAAL